MELLKLLFFESTGKEFSWRKAMTALTTLTFVVACIGFLITHKFNELPPSYQAIIGGVFVFYFGKGLIDGKKIKVE